MGKKETTLRAVGHVAHAPCRCARALCGKRPLFEKRGCARVSSFCGDDDGKRMAVGSESSGSVGLDGFR